VKEDKIRVLLADDNQDFCDVVGNFLDKQADMELCGTAYDGQSALEKIRELRPDVAIIDGVMPRLDGQGLLERLQNEEHRPICIILSAISQEKVVQKALEL